MCRYRVHINYDESLTEDIIEKTKKRMEQQDTSGVRFKAGTQTCTVCGTNKDVIQFERKTKRKGITVFELAFFCRKDAENEELIKDSTEIEYA